MTAADAEAQIVKWLDKYGGAVRFVLAHSGVPEGDQPDIVQQVFCRAYLALVAGEQIEYPQQWLIRSARGQASNFRRKAAFARSDPATLDELSCFVDTRLRPDEQAEYRERLQWIFEKMEPEARQILLDVSALGMSFEEIASKYGVSARTARYRYKRAVNQAQDLGRRLDPKKRSYGVFPLLLSNLFGFACSAPRPSPKARSRGMASMEQRLDGEKHANKDIPEAGYAPASPAPLSPISIRITNPSAFWYGPALVTMVSGLAIGVIVGWLLHTPSSSEPTHIELNRAQPSLVESEPSSPPVVSPATIFTGVTPSASPSLSPRPAVERTPVAHEWKAPVSEEQQLLDQAFSSMVAGNALRSLNALAEHARRFPTSHVATRHKTLAQVCVTPVARGAAPCAGILPESATP